MLPSFMNFDTMSYFVIIVMIIYVLYYFSQQMTLSFIIDVNSTISGLKKTVRRNKNMHF